MKKFKILVLLLVVTLLMGVVYIKYQPEEVFVVTATDSTQVVIDTLVIDTNAVKINNIIYKHIK